LSRGHGARRERCAMMRMFENPRPSGMPGSRASTRPESGATSRKGRSADAPIERPGKFPRRS
jgi:hypothetical protein